jgi:HAE1 family hydrophobic/amphiphilic exporter-1
VRAAAERTRRGFEEDLDGARYRRHRETRARLVRRIALVVPASSLDLAGDLGVCLAGTIWLFMLVPKAFLPPGDSSVIFGAFIAREGSSPEQMREYQDRVDEVLHEDPNVITDFTMTGATGFSRRTRASLLRSSSRPKSAPIARSDGGDDGQAQHDSRRDDVSAAVSGARDQHRRYQSEQGQYAFTVSGANPEQVYEVGQKLMGKLMEYPGFLTVSSDFTTTRPTSTSTSSRSGEDLRRLRSAHSDAAAQRLLAKLSLPDQETGGSVSGDSGDGGLRAREAGRSVAALHQIRRRQRLVPLSELVTWKSTLGPQAVNHLNQFTSMTLFFNLKPGVALGDATNFITKAAAKIVPPTMRAELQGEAQTFSEHGDEFDDPDGAGGVRDVRDPGDPLRELRASADRALDAADGAGRRAVDADCVWQEASLYAFVGMFMLMGIVKKNGIMIVDFARQRVEAGESAEQAIHDASMDRFRPI